MISSGENLSAAIVSGLSDVIIASDRNGLTADGLAPGAAAMIKFALSHEGEINSLAARRERPWAEWGAALLKDVRATFKF